MLNAGYREESLPAYLDNNHWFMRMLRLRDYDEEMEKLDKLLSDDGKGGSIIIHQVALTLFDLYPFLYVSNRLDECELLIDHVNHIAELYPTEFDRFMRTEL